MLRRVLRLSSLAAVAVTCGACPHSQEIGWQEALQHMGSTRALHSLSFVHDGSQGVRTSVAIFDNEVENPCHLYETGGSPKNDFWHLSLHLGSSSAGLYQLVPNFTPSNSSGGELTLTHVVNGRKRQQFPALAGQVEVLAAVADEAAWNAGADLRLRIRGEFEAHPKTQIKCSDHGDIHGVIGGTCVCEDEKGERSECELDPKAPDENCCIDLKAPRIYYETEILQPARCRSMCTWLFSYTKGYIRCRELEAYGPLAD